MFHSSRAWALSLLAVILCSAASLAQPAAPSGGKLRPELALHLGHASWVKSVAFSADGARVASAGLDDAVKLWDAKDGTLLYSWEHVKVSEGHPLSFKADGSLTVALADGKAQAWDAASSAWRGEDSQRKPQPENVASSPDGQWRATGVARGVEIRDVRTGALRHKFPHEQMVSAVAFSPDGSILASGSTHGEVGSCTLKLWDWRKARLLRTVPIGTYVLALAFSADGRTLAVGTNSSAVQLRDARTGVLSHALGLHQGIYGVSFIPGTSLITASLAGPTDGIQLWDTQGGKLRRVLKQVIRDQAASADGKLFAGGGGKKPSAYLFDARTMQLLQQLPSQASEFHPVAFSPGGELLAFVGQDFRIRLWSLKARKTERVLASSAGHRGEIASLAFSSKGLLASGGTDATVKLWDVKSGRLRHSWDDHGATVRALSFAPDGATLASGSWDGTVRVWDVASKSCRAILGGHQAMVLDVGFSPGGGVLASSDLGTIRLWDTKTWHGATDKPICILRGHTSYVESLDFSSDGKRMVSSATDGTVKLWNCDDPARPEPLATLITLPDISEITQSGFRALSIGARSMSAGESAAPLSARAIEDAGNEWFITTPEGWFDCSANAARFVRWRVNNQIVPAERYYRVLRRPDLVRKALRGGAVPEPDLSSQDIPPQAQFTRVQYAGGKAKAADSVTATLEVRGRYSFKDVTVLVNGRPLPPENEAPIEVRDVPADLEARPLDIGARPLDLGARPLDIGAREPSADAISTATVPEKDTQYTVAKRYKFRVPLPRGASEIKIRAFAYDAKELGSNPTEVTMSRSGTRRVPGNLYILSAGVSRYRNGRDGKVAAATGFSNLKFSAQDARAVVRRLQNQGAPLYNRVEVFRGGPLLDTQATLTNLRAGLKWLQSKARPGQVDTVVIFLSGHGLSDPQGRYYFPTYNFDRVNWQGTSLSGKELQAELGGKLRARSVFLFVDTCHSGALAGARSDDLNFEVNSSGVYMLASSGSTQYSYESARWKHGAFTLALLNSLARKELASEGTIKFNVLTYAVPDEIARLMREAGQSESAMAPVVPLEGRRLDEPVAQVR